MVFCFAASTSAIVAAPDRACPLGAKLSERELTCPRTILSFLLAALARASLLSAGAANKKRTAFAVPFRWLPLTDSN